MRWPFGPPHLTLKPSKKNKKNNKKRNKTKTKQKTNKEGLRAKWGGPSGHLTWPLNPPKKNTKTTKQKKKTKKNQKKKKKTRKNQKYQKLAFQLSVKIFFFFWVAFENFPFLTPWPRKRAPKKHYKNRGFRPPFLENRCVSRNGRFWTQKPQIYKFQLSFFLPVFFSFNNTKHKHSLKPLFL